MDSDARSRKGRDGMLPLTEEERKRAFAATRKPDVIRK